MKQRMMMIIISVLVALLAALALFLGVNASTRPYREYPDGITALESVELGGMQQQLLIRGQDTSNPVLL